MTTRQFLWLLLRTTSLGLIVFVAKGVPLELMLVGAVGNAVSVAVVALLARGLRRPTLPPKE